MTTFGLEYITELKNSAMNMKILQENKNNFHVVADCIDDSICTFLLNLQVIVDSPLSSDEEKNAAKAALDELGNI